MTKPGPNKVTIRDIAKSLGLSAATISRSLRQDRLIHPNTRARVVKAALELGYQGRSRNRSPGRTSAVNVGILLAVRSDDEARSDPIWMRCLEGLGAEADAASVGIHLIPKPATTRGSVAGPGPLPSALKSGAIDVLVIHGRHSVDDVRLWSTHVPTVSIDFPFPGCEVDLVCSQDAIAIRMLVRHLHELGHRKLAWIEGFLPNIGFFEARLSGFIQGLLDCGHNPADAAYLRPKDWVKDAPDVLAGQVDRMVRSGVTAFVCANDYVACDIALAARQLDLRVPDDISITGYDALGPIHLGGFEFTSIDPHFIEIGRCALRLALQRVAQPAGSRLIMSVPVRMSGPKSTGPALGHRVR